MAANRSPRLRDGGQSIMAGSAASAPSTHRGPTPKTIKDMSIEEMESALTHFSKRVPERGRAVGGPQIARMLLEENKQLIEEKAARKALERKNSKEFTETLLAKDRVTTENDRARDVGRRHAQQELAQYYKSKIAEKETAKAEEYRSKVQSGIEIQYFPFVEGENISKSREAQNMNMREEMRSFLKQQHKENPPRADSLIADVDIKRGQLRNDEFGDVLASDSEVAPHMQRYPRFMSRAREHMSRRLHDHHVRKALEERVHQTKVELETTAKQLQLEAQQMEDGMLVNDVLRYDSSQSKAMERRRNAEYLQSQMRERQSKNNEEKHEFRKEPAGYWGPEEKEMQSVDMYKGHSKDLVQQMETNQHRRLNSRCRRLRQERRLIDNCMAEMSLDRDRDHHKHTQHREVLTTTWKSQQKIRQAQSKLQAM